MKITTHISQPVKHAHPHARDSIQLHGRAFANAAAAMATAVVGGLSRPSLIAAGL
jgi:hypothetical protein